MVLEVLISVQKYITVILLFIAAFIWLLLRKERGEEGLADLRINRAYTVIVLMVLPFIIGNFSLVSEELSEVGMNFLFVLIFLSMVVVLLKLNKRSSKERENDLRDLMKESSKHPIRYEFAKRIVVPEITKLRKIEDKLDNKNKKFKLKEKKLDVKQKGLDKTIKKLEELKKFISDNLKRSNNAKKEESDRERVYDKKESVLIVREKKLDAVEKDVK